MTHPFCRGVAPLAAKGELSWCSTAIPFIDSRQQIFLLPFPFLLWKLPEVCAWWVIKDESSVIACGKVLKTNIFIAFPHEIACGEVIKTNIFITFPNEIAWGKVIKIFVLPGVYKRGCSWTPAQFPFGNQRSNTSGEKLLLGKS